MTSALWPDLHATALIGTQRKPWRMVQTTGPVAQLVPTVGVQESDILLAAGALTLARRAGIEARHDVAASVPAPVDDRPGVPAPAARRLRLLLHGTTDVELLAVWLRLAAERGLLAPPDQLPALFQLAGLRRELRPLVVSVAGSRGAWLAAYRSEWQFVLDGRAAAAVELDERVWQEGSMAERKAYLSALRDQDPAAGRGRLREVWATEPPAERAAFLGALERGLSLDDEDFCEAALGDRRKEVRSAAAELLGRMTGSAYQRRMTDRVRACIAVQRRRLTVRPPGECDAEMRRDGIEAKPPTGTGERAWWLEQVVAAAPLSIWRDIAATADAMLKIDIETGWATTMWRAWARAAVGTGAVDWAEALIRRGFGADKSAELHDTALASALYDLLPADSVIAAATRLAGGPADGDLTALDRLLAACPAPWPTKFASTMFGFLHRAVRTAHPSWVPARVQSIAHSVVAGLAPESLPSLVTLAERVRAEAARAGTPDSAGVRLMDSLVSTVSVRHTMFQEFA